MAGEITPEMARAELARRQQAAQASAIEPPTPEDAAPAPAIAMPEAITPEMARAELARRSAAAGQTQTPAPDEPVFSGSILPVSKNPDGDIYFDSDAGLLGVAKRAFSLPGEVYEGKVDPMSPEGIERAVEFAGTFSPAGAATRGVSGAAAAAVPNVIRAPVPGSGAAVAEAGQRLGVALPRAVTTDRQSIQQAGKIIANVPIGGTPIRKAAENAIQQLDDAALRTREGFGAGSPAIAGEAVRSDLKTYITDTIDGRIADGYNKVDGLVDQTATAPLSATQRVAAEINSRRANAAISKPSPAVALIEEGISRPDGLNYQGIKTLRTYVGELLDNPSALPSDMSGAELKQIYGSLTNDLRNVVRKGGGSEAARAFEEANTFASRAATERQALNRFLGAQNDEGLFDRLVKTAGSTASADIKQLYNARMAVSNETWDEVASAVIARLGRGPDGTFSPERFTSAYGKLTPGGRRALFQTSGKDDLAQSLDDIAQVSGRFKELQKFANPSGTGQTLTGVSILGTGMFADPVSALSTVVGARAVSGLLAKPASARQIAAWTKTMEAAARKPSSQTRQLLQARTSVLSTAIAQELGVPDQAGRIAAGLESVARGEPDTEQEEPLRDMRFEA